MEHAEWALKGRELAARPRIRSPSDRLFISKSRRRGKARDKKSGPSLLDAGVGPRHIPRDDEGAIRAFYHRSATASPLQIRVRYVPPRTGGISAQTATRAL